MLKEKKAYIFDLDGTLVDSMWVWLAIDEAFLGKYHLTQPEGFYAEMEGMSYSETAAYFLKQFPKLPHTLEELMQEWYEMAYSRYTEEVTLKKGAKEFLEHAHANGIRLGIATSNQRELAVASLKALGVLDLFDSIWTSCEAKAGKPAPDVYLRVAEALEVEPKDCLVFEDVPNGILAGKRAGMEVCAVEDAFSKDQDEKKRELADYYIKNYDEIKNNTYEVLR